MPSAIELATLLRDFVDVLIPGEGVVARCLGRRASRACWRCACSRCAASRVPPSSRRHCSPRVARWPRWTPPAAAAWSSASSASMPNCSRWSATPAYVAYYESPAVVRAVAALGQPYRAMPGKDGYPMAPFDLERDRPTARARRLHPHRRGPAARSGPAAWRRAWRAREEPADVLIIGSGATGAIAAKVLGEAGLKVVCLEQGGWVEPGDHPHYRRRLAVAAAHPTGVPTSTSAPIPTTSRSAATPRRC